MPLLHLDVKWTALRIGASFLLRRLNLQELAFRGGVLARGEVFPDTLAATASRDAKDDFA